MVYISSSAIITKSLIELGWIADPEAESILGLLVFEDIVIAVSLAVGYVLVMSVPSTVLTSQSARVEELAERLLGSGTPAGGPPDPESS